MSLPDQIAARKPQPDKPRRWGLYGPFIALAIAAAAWSGYWAVARDRLAAGLDTAAANLTTAGYPLSWKERTIGGYPFRMDVTLTEVRAAAPGGWALEAPRIDAEANAFSLGSWLIAAPVSLTFVRPQGGPVVVTGKLVRASLTHLTSHPPSLSFEGVKLNFAPAPGAQPFALTAADRVEFHLRAGPNDEGGVFASVENGQARVSGLFARVADGKPVSIVWNSTISKVSAFNGKSWPDAVRRWSDAGGTMTVRQAGLTAGDAIVGATGGSLRAAPDGRLAGTLPLTLRQAPRALTAMGETGVIDPSAATAAGQVAEARQAGGDAAQATLYFQAGRTTLGPVALGAAPKVYDPN